MGDIVNSNKIDIPFYIYYTRLIELACQNNEYIDMIPLFGDCIPDNLSSAVKDLKANNRSWNYLKTHYGIEDSGLDLSFQDIVSDFNEKYAKELLLSIITNSVKNIDNNSICSLDMLIDDLSLVKEKFIDVADDEYLFFTEDDSDYNELQQFLDRSVVELGIPSWDNTGAPFNYLGSLGMVMTKTSHGKTWSLLHIACHNVKKGLKVLYLHHENDRSEIRHRCYPILSNGRITWRSFFDKSPETQLYLKEEIDDLKKKYGRNFLLKSYNHTNSKFTLENIRMDIHKFRPDVVLIDYLQLIEGAKDWQINITPELYKMAKSYNTSIIVACQAHPNSTADKELPDVGDSSKNKSYADDCDWVITGASKKDETGIIRLKMDIKKGRQGQSGMVNLFLDPNLGKLTEAGQEESLFGNPDENKPKLSKKPRKGYIIQ